MVFLGYCVVLCVCVCLCSDLVMYLLLVIYFCAAFGFLYMLLRVDCVFVYIFLRFVLFASDVLYFRGYATV